MTREAKLARTFVELADTLVAEFDVVEILTLLTDRCVEVLDVAAAGIMLTDQDGNLRVMASSSDTMRVLELLEVQHQQGPCLDCFRSGAPAMEPALRRAVARWPDFAPAASAAGFESVHALPMRLRGTILGALNLFHLDAGTMPPADVDAAQALADIATIAILQHRAALDSQLVNTQLTGALNSRVVIEQAKGMIAEATGVDVTTAFRRLRAHARNHNERMVDVADGVIAGSISGPSLDEL